MANENLNNINESGLEIKNELEETDLTEAEPLLVWEAPEFPIYDRNWKWYATAFGVLGLLLIYAVYSGNFTFALLIVMGAVLLYMRTVVSPATIPIAFMEDGLFYGETFHAYKDFKRFWICYEPPSVKNLYLDFARGVNRRLTIPLNEQDPNEARELIRGFIKEDLTQSEEPNFDFVTRLLRL